MQLSTLGRPALLLPFCALSKTSWSVAVRRFGRCEAFGDVFFSLQNSEAEKEEEASLAPLAAAAGADADA